MKLLIEEQILISFSESDPQGILFHSRIFDINHRLFEEFFSRQEVGWSYWFQNSEFAVPLKSCSCDFFKPLRAGQEYQARLYTKNLSASAVVLSLEIHDHESLCAKTETVHVFVNAADFKKIDIPEKIRNLF